MKKLILLAFLISYAAFSQHTSLMPIPGETYVITAWVSQEDPQNSMISYTAPKITVSCGTTYEFLPSGKIIDGWQRISGEFTVSLTATGVSINLHSAPGLVSYYDDIRLTPLKSSMKSFVYDRASQKLMAELDENNYATFYEYDSEGGLIRVKKETEDGVFTIQETRSSTKK